MCRSWWGPLAHDNELDPVSALTKQSWVWDGFILPKFLEILRKDSSVVRNVEPDWLVAMGTNWWEGSVSYSWDTLSQ